MSYPPELETDTIAELFARQNAMDLTGPDNPGRRRIIAKYRENRELFAAGLKAPKEKKVKPIDTEGMMDF